MFVLEMSQAQKHQKQPESERGPLNSVMARLTSSAAGPKATFLPTRRMDLLST